MSFSKKLGLVSVALVFAMSSSSNAARAAEEMKIGLVDMQKALQTVDAGKKAKAQLEKDVEAKKKEFQSEESAIKKMGEEFKKQSLVMNDEARAKKQGELQERIMKLQEKGAKTEQELRRKEAELTQPILSRLRNVINEVAKQKGYHMVLEKNDNTVLFSQEKDDLTADVISSFNKKSG